MSIRKQPIYLKKGDKVSIISSARKISEEELEPIIQLLKSWGLVVVLGNNLFKIENQFAGIEKERAQDLQSAIDNPEIKAIFFARGGYGTVQIIDNIDWKQFSKAPKWLIGFSDVTVVHSHVNRNWGIETVHSWMPINLVGGKTTNEAIACLKQLLFGSDIEYNWEKHSLTSIEETKIEGELVGGNLSILYSLNGSESQLDLNNKILFIEDLDEYLYHIDRMMMALKRSKLFEGCKAVLVGGMSEMNDNAVPYGKNALEIIKGNLSHLNIPIAFGFPAGHIEDNRPLIFGRKVSLSKIKDSMRLKIHGRA